MRNAPVGGSYDVVILGGGPAGSATALALKRSDATSRVALIEKTDYSGLRIGETLPPPAQQPLTELGVWEAFLRRSPMESPGTRAAWGSARFHENEFIFSPYGRGWHLDRRDFDSMLVDHAEQAGVDVFRNAVAHVSDSHNEEWSLTLRQLDPPASVSDECEPALARLTPPAQNGCHADDHSARSPRPGAREAPLERAPGVRARFVVDATGRRSTFSMTQGARHLVFDQLVGVAVFLRLGPADPQPDASTSVEACEHGWWYTARVPNAEMAAVFMTDASQLRRLSWRTSDDWRSLTVSAPDTASRVAGGVPLRDPSLYPASSQRLDACAGDQWLAVGDAACTFDPLSSQGVMKALRSGIDAAHAIRRHLSGDARALSVYADRVATGYDDYLDKRSAYYAMEQRWPDAPFWRYRHEVVTLHPDQWLRSIPAPVTQTKHLSSSTRLSTAELQRLAETCVLPLPAHQIVTAFKARNDRVRSDRHVLLALQDLIAGGRLIVIGRPAPADSRS